MLSKISGSIIAVIGIVVLSLHNESYAFDRLDKDTPLTASTAQSCNATSKTQIPWRYDSKFLVNGSDTPVIEPSVMAVVTPMPEVPEQTIATVEAADVQTKTTHSHSIVTPSSEVSPPISPSPTLLPSQITPNETSLNADVIFTMINQYRTSIGLPAFKKDGEVCSVATSRAPELYNEIMITHTMHQGFYARNLPYWATENVIYMNSEQAAVNWWLSSPVHHAAIAGDYTYSCIACSGNSCAEIFTNYQHK